MIRLLSLVNIIQQERKASESFLTLHWRWIRLAIMLVIDSVLIAVSFWVAFVLRLDDIYLGTYQTTFLKSLWPLIVIHAPIFFAVGVYRHVWRFATIRTAISVAAAVTIAASLFSFLTYVPGSGLRGVPRSVPAIYTLVASMLLVCCRFFWRFVTSRSIMCVRSSQPPCLIYGAGSSGELLARHISRNPIFPFCPVGFIDDDRNKLGRLIHGLKIIGSGVDLSRLVRLHKISNVIIAIPSMSGGKMREIVAKCQEAGAKPLIMPDVATSLREDVFLPRPIDVKDLLKRSPKFIDDQLVREFFSSRVVLVTGAGGSIGSEICRQVVRFKPKKLVLLDVSEFNLYQIEIELRDLKDHSVDIIPVLGSVTEARVVEHAIKTHRPSCILHAAAFKHVPLVECNPSEGILNNVLGTKVVAEAASQYAVERFLLVSTDKAVRPTNIMGASKRCCELIIQAVQGADGNKCKFSSVRFGNVLGSSGSVVPRFLAQIQAGGPVTVTHPEVTRYFMLTSEAVALVIQSICMAKGGEIFVLNMGEPVRILEMAHQFILLAGKVPGKDIEIEITGLRPGEKLYEELILEGSEEKTLHGDVFVATSSPIDADSLMAKVERLLSAARAYETSACRELLQDIIGQKISPADLDGNHKEWVENLKSDSSPSLQTHSYADA